MSLTWEAPADIFLPTYQVTKVGPDRSMSWGASLNSILTLDSESNPRSKPPILRKACVWFLAIKGKLRDFGMMKTGHFLVPS